MRPAIALFNELAPDYDEHFAVPHRRAYDDLAWELTTDLLQPAPATVVDVGCGVGRWADRLTAAGYTVIGVEPSPAMAAGAARRLADRDFTLLRTHMEDTALPAASVDAVLAMGSLQYAIDPSATIARFSTWLRPGGVACVVVDSLIALVIELLRSGCAAEALERLQSRRGVWTQHGRSAELHLFDAATAGAAFRAVGLMVERTCGLLVGSSVHGRDELTRRLAENYEQALATERAVAQRLELADLGKQLFLAARRPTDDQVPGQRP
jgi:SAM-dependent methyltransferase